MTYKSTKYTCYFTYVAMATIFVLPPMLFVTFRRMYGISYTLLGTLVLINFCTQLAVDLVFTFFTKYFNIRKTVRVMPMLTATGLVLYALIPWLFPELAYTGLVLGTAIFSVSAGLSEVLLSPLVAAIPSDNPGRDMSMLHSLYAYGVLGVVIVSNVFLKVFGADNWMYLTLALAVLPVIAFVLYCKVPLPEVSIQRPSKPSSGNRKLMLLFVLCIFFGSAAENSMTNWISGYMEKALHIPKLTGDILGLALFAVLLGMGRTAYAKYGKNISSVLLWSMLGATVCYILAGVSSSSVISLVACTLTGLFTSMLWPGTLIMMEEEIPGCGVTAYALMAAGGDFGASVAPQMLGVVVDKVSVSKWASEVSVSLSLTTEQLGMKVGMLAAAVFPLLGVLLLIYIKKVIINNR